MTGPCAKQTVTAIIVCADGQRLTGTNSVENPQAVCPRGSLPTGVGYELCQSVCRQGAHAEIKALAAAGDKAQGGTLYLTGHTYACGPCSAAVEAAGARLVIGPAPAEYLACAKCDSAIDLANLLLHDGLCRACEDAT